MQKGAASRKKQTYIGIAVIILVFGILSVPALIRKVAEGKVIDSRPLDKGQEGVPLDYVYQGEERRKVPSFQLIDQDSLPFGSNQLEGKVWVLDFFFTTCPTICPKMSRNLQAIQEEFQGEELGIISITINPSYDTPEKLRDYSERYGAGENWKFLTGDKELIYEISRQGFYMYAEEGEEYPGGFEHSGLFALIDANGFIRSRKDEFGNPLIYYRGAILPEEGVNSQGETQQIDILMEDIRKLLSE